MNTPPGATQTVQLPQPKYPILTRMLCRQCFHEHQAQGQKQVVTCPHCKGQLSIEQPAGKEEPVQWVVGEGHPLVPNTRVMRMFVEDGVVEVYSVSTDTKGTAGMRNLVPMDHVILVEEAMPFDVFVELLTEAEGLGAEPGEKAAPAENGQQNVS